MSNKLSNAASGISLKAKCLDWLMRRVHYLSSDLKYYRLTPSGFSLNEQDKTHRCLVLILSRRCYQEKTETFPIASATELKKILQQRDEQGTHYYYIAPLQDGHRRVTTFTLTKEAAISSEGAVWVFPISLLCAFSVPKQIYDVRTPDSRFFFLATTLYQWQSVMASPLLSDVSKALLMMGGAAQTPAITISDSSLVAMINRAWFKLKPAVWFAALVVKPAKKVAFRWQPLVLSVAGLVAAYLSLSSWYLNQQYTQRQQKLVDYNSQLDQVLSSRRQLEQTEQLVAMLSERISKPEQSIAIWSIIAFLHQQKVRITILQSDMQQVTLQGETDSATDLLQQLLQHNYVSDASFSAPVRRGQAGRELFTIVMALNSAVFKPAVAENNTVSEPTE